MSNGIKSLKALVMGTVLVFCTGLANAEEEASVPYLPQGGEEHIFHDRFQPSCLVGDGGTPALSWEADGIADDEVLTLSTDGSCPFGALGPELIILMDLAGMASGDIDIDSIVLCDDCVLVGGSSHEIENVSGMPGGKGLVMGGIGDSLNPTSTPRFRVDHPPYTRGFDSRVTYWPKDHQLSAMDYLLGNMPDYPGSAAWQIKPIWKMSDEDYQGSDTDFFLGALYNWYSPLEYFKSAPVMSSNSVGTYYLPSGPLQHDGDMHRRPFAEPYTIEYGWDQGSLTKAFDASVDVNIGTAVQGGLYRHVEEEIRLHVVDGQTRMVNHFTYPGYIRGFSRTLNLHFYEGELYKTGGEGAFARVALSDHADYYAAGKRTLLQPVSWSNEEIQVRMRAGWFDLDDLDGVYINIINADNVQVGSIKL